MANKDKVFKKFFKNYQRENKRKHKKLNISIIRF